MNLVCTYICTTTVSICARYGLLFRFHGCVNVCGHMLFAYFHLACLLLQLIIGHVSDNGYTFAES